MKKIISTIIFASLFMAILNSCDSQKVIVNREVDSQRDGKMLLGAQTKEQFLKSPYNDWYNKEHSDYAVDQKSIAELKKRKLNSYKITVFLGTWCSDSQREFPRLMKILESVKYPMQKLTIIAVNRKKESPNGEEGQYNIQKVPTIIVSKYGTEVGRIIESPQSGWLERDLLDLLKKNNASLKNLF